MPLQGATEVVARYYALALLFITPLALVNATVGQAGSALATVQGRVLDMLLGPALRWSCCGWVRRGLRSAGRGKRQGHEASESRKTGAPHLKAWLASP